MKVEGSDIRDQPAYGPAEAARYLRLPAATLRSWFVGRDYPRAGAQATFHPLIKPAFSQPPEKTHGRSEVFSFPSGGRRQGRLGGAFKLSFYNLIEAHVLRSLRTEHGVALADLRNALTYAQNKLHLQRLLLSAELRAHAGQVFLDRYFELINLSASGQLAMRRMFEAHLQRVEWDAWQFPVRLYPYVDATHRSAERPISIDPRVAFGRPVVQRKGISTAAITARIDAGESVDALAEDYDLSRDGIEQAVLYARAA